MSFIFYWFAWMFVILTLFFVKSTSERRMGLLFIGLSMCLYPNTAFLFHAVFVLFAGLCFWLKYKKSVLLHAWPFALSLGYSAYQLFIFINPVWALLPGRYFIMAVALFFLYKWLGSYENAAGFWLIVSGLGMTLTVCVMIVSRGHVPADPQSFMLITLIGLLMIMGIRFIYEIKKQVRRYLFKNLYLG